MIEIQNRDNGKSVTYSAERAARMWGADELSRMLRGEHPGMTAREVNGRGHGKEMTRTVCPWCEPPRVIEVRPSPDGLDRTTHSICSSCSSELLSTITREDEIEAVEIHWSRGRRSSDSAEGTRAGACGMKR